VCQFAVCGTCGREAVIRVAIDAVGNRSGGGAVVLLELLSALVRDPRVEGLDLFCSPERERGFSIPAHARLEIHESFMASSLLLCRLGWCVAGFARASRRVGADVALLLNGHGFVRHIPAVAFVQQALPYSPEALNLVPLALRWRMRGIGILTNLSCRRADCVIVQSPTMARTMSKKAGLDLERIVVQPPSVRTFPQGESSEVAMRMNGVPPDRRLLYVGSDLVYKNVDLVASAMSELSARISGATLFVTLPAEHSTARFADVSALERLDDVGLATAYRHSTVVVQPSLVESGPLVPPEAMLFRKPLLVADRPWAHDACGDAAVYFDPCSSADLLAKATMMLQDAELRASLAARGAALVKARIGQHAVVPLLEVLKRVANLQDGQRSRGEAATR
jgi:glycosyltransferase involved in cell wall biosynthesis